MTLSLSLELPVLISGFYSHGFLCEWIKVKAVKASLNKFKILHRLCRLSMEHVLYFLFKCFTCH